MGYTQPLEPETLDPQGQAGPWKGRAWQERPLQQLDQDLNQSMGQTDSCGPKRSHRVWKVGARPLSSLALGVGMGDGPWAKRSLDILQVSQLRNHLSPWSQLGVGLRGGSPKGKRKLPSPFLSFPDPFLKNQRSGLSQLTLRTVRADGMGEMGDKGGARGVFL